MEVENGDVGRQENNIVNNSTTDQTNDPHEERFRRVHPGAASAIGRSITDILRDRSLIGSRRVSFFRNNSFKNAGISQSSSSSSMKIEMQEKHYYQSHLSPSSSLDYRSDTLDNVSENNSLTDTRGPTVDNNNNNDNDKINLHSNNASQFNATTNQNVPRLYRNHLNSFPCSIKTEIRNYGELYSITKFRSSYFPWGGDGGCNAVSTISVAFSTDGAALASTHGDHTVKITCCHSGRLLKQLEGHPRTPWTVKFHPTNKYIVASGCLGFQVRIWNWNLDSNNCLNFIRLSYAIISVAFHPAGNILAVASGSSLYLWDYDNEYGPPSQQQQQQNAIANRTSNTSNDNSESSQVAANNNSNATTSRNVTNHTSSISNNNQSAVVNILRQQQILQQQQQQQRRRIERGRAVRGMVVEVRQENSLRCVHFPPKGNTIIIGGVNPRSSEAERGMSFSLKLFDFDIIALSNRRRMSAERHERPLKNGRTIIPRALLYNDGGFDVSPCGRYLCACAEYWLPHNVECATQLFPSHDFYSDDDDNTRSVDSLRTPDRGGSMDIEGKKKVRSESRSSKSNTSTPPRVKFGENSSVPTNIARSTSNQTQSLQQQQHQQQQRYQTHIPSSQYPLTPPSNSRQSVPLSPPSPPGRRLYGGLSSGHANNSALNRGAGGASNTSFNNRNDFPYRNPGAGGRSISPPPPPSSVSPAMRSANVVEGGFVPHVVTVSLDTSRPNFLGSLLEAAPLDGERASGVTCVKFSPSAEFCLLGYGVRENVSSRANRQRQSGRNNTGAASTNQNSNDDNNNNASENNNDDIDIDELEEEPCHSVTGLYRIRGGMTHVSSMMSQDDDVNIARFHPHSGHGFVYGTKQGRVRILSPKPWNYFDENNR